MPELLLEQDPLKGLRFNGTGSKLEPVPGIIHSSRIVLKRTRQGRKSEVVSRILTVDSLTQLIDWLVDENLYHLAFPCLALQRVLTRQPLNPLNNTNKLESACNATNLLVQLKVLHHEVHLRSSETSDRAEQTQFAAEDKARLQRMALSWAEIALRLTRLAQTDQAGSFIQAAELACQKLATEKATARIQSLLALTKAKLLLLENNYPCAVTLSTVAMELAKDFPDIWLAAFSTKIDGLASDPVLIREDIDLYDHSQISCAHLGILAALRDCSNAVRALSDRLKTETSNKGLYEGLLAEVRVIEFQLQLRKAKCSYFKLLLNAVNRVDMDVCAFLRHLLQSSEWSKFNSSLMAFCESLCNDLDQIGDKVLMLRGILIPCLEYWEFCVRALSIAQIDVFDQSLQYPSDAFCQHAMWAVSCAEKTINSSAEILDEGHACICEIEIVRKFIGEAAKGIIYAIPATDNENQKFINTEYFSVISTAFDRTQGLLHDVNSSVASIPSVKAHVLNAMGRLCLLRRELSAVFLPDEWSDSTDEDLTNHEPKMAASAVESRRMTPETPGIYNIAVNSVEDIEAPRMIAIAVQAAEGLLLSLGGKFKKTEATAAGLLTVYQACAASCRLRACLASCLLASGSRPVCAAIPPGDSLLRYHRPRQQSELGRSLQRLAWLSQGSSNMIAYLGFYSTVMPSGPLELITSALGILSCGLLMSLRRRGGLSALNSSCGSEDHVYTASPWWKRAMEDVSNNRKVWKLTGVNLAACFEPSKSIFTELSAAFPHAGEKPGTNANTTGSDAGFSRYKWNLLVVEQSYDANCVYMFLPRAQTSASGQVSSAVNSHNISSTANQDSDHNFLQRIKTSFYSLMCNAFHSSCWGSKKTSTDNRPIETIVDQILSHIPCDLFSTKQIKDKSKKAATGNRGPSNKNGLVLLTGGWLFDLPIENFFHSPETVRVSSVSQSSSKRPSLSETGHASDKLVWVARDFSIQTLLNRFFNETKTERSSKPASKGAVATAERVFSLCTRVRNTFKPQVSPSKGISTQKQPVGACFKVAGTDIIFLSRGRISNAPCSQSARPHLSTGEHGRQDQQQPQMTARKAVKEQAEMTALNLTSADDKPTGLLESCLTVYQPLRDELYVDDSPTELDLTTALSEGFHGFVYLGSEHLGELIPSNQLLHVKTEISSTAAPVGTVAYQVNEAAYTPSSDPGRDVECNIRLFGIPNVAIL
ncbi:unnamed protein product [Schistocephalus solidus]|uniref:Separase n=1 Tax=Schistocephalus solidus TaxID=70667 RepID=A0A183SV69_SCHSO|nr:unnamed protein product [Schistocephalus solidus]